MDSIDRLIADVQAQNTVIESMRVFINGLKHQVAEALSGVHLTAEYQARLAAIFPSLEANTDAIAQAISTPPDATPPIDPIDAPANDAVLPPDPNFAGSTITFDKPDLVGTSSSK